MNSCLIPAVELSWMGVGGRIGLPASLQPSLQEWSPSRLLAPLPVKPDHPPPTHCSCSASTSVATNPPLNWSQQHRVDLGPAFKTSFFWSTAWLQEKETHLLPLPPLLQREADRPGVYSCCWKTSSEEGSQEQVLFIKFHTFFKNFISSLYGATWSKILQTTPKT